MLSLIPLLPLLGWLTNSTVTRRAPKTVSGWIATGAIGAAFGVALSQVWAMLHQTPIDGVRAIDETVFTWISSGRLNIPLAFRLDPLSSVMILVITGIGTLIHLYSTAYMHDESDSEYARYFSYLNLFAAFMLVLVLGANFPVMFIGWEGVGLCSYLLIGFWFTKPSAADAGKKAFVVNRIGDFGFILGMFALFWAFGTLDFQEIASKVAALPADPASIAGAGLLTGATLLLFLGATGKSAQLPLYVWLPDAMEGPTPVSALIHAATMVTAGVYMIGRNAVLFSHAPFTLEVVAVVGALTALMAGTIGLVQNDIKRVLAYSTVSQLGYMFLAMGVGAYATGIFHLWTHAFFKALLFLGSGAVIHALHGEQDMRHMGGLKKHLPITFWTFLVGTIAIAGLPPFAGFFSKDEILWKTFAAGHTVLWGMAVLTAFLTAVYMFRLLYMTFYGERRTAPSHAAPAPGHAAHGTGHAAPAPGHAAHGTGHGLLHDAPAPMAIALVLLALGSGGAGLFGIPAVLRGNNAIEHYLAPSFRAIGGPEIIETAYENHSLEVGLMLFSVLVAVAGIAVASMIWLRNPQIAANLAARFKGLHTLLYNKYFVDEAYDATLVQPIKRTSTGLLWRGVDAGLIDGTVNGVGLVVRGWSAVLRRMQTGSVRAYAMSLFTGVVVIVGYYLWR
ncbi:MAG TPA: NADH-quinone oxidoreductase subunit L [Vicinamibacterales bacterium]|nr:NADH-quinone oxidoreductase subunit L [Vicinamibacterales bacterium]